MTTRLDEIAARLEFCLQSGEPGLLAASAHTAGDVAFLLAEVKRLEDYTLEQEHRNARECGGWIKRVQAAEVLALSLAEALERGRDYLAALEENIMRNDADMRLDECQPPSVAVRDMSAALSDPRLLKLKGGV